MPVTDTKASLLAGIVENPGDDAPRLVLADWLEEFGDTKDRERAEFIRLQVELALPWHEPIPDSASSELRGMRRRAGELFRWGDVRGPCGLGAGVMSGRNVLVPEETAFEIWDVPPGGVVPPGSPRFRFVWRRGFVESVRLPLAAWLGEACPASWPGGKHVSDTRHLHQGAYVCAACRGTGFTGGHDLGLVRAHPIIRVEVTDKVASKYHNNGGPPPYGWLNSKYYSEGTELLEERLLPEDLWQAVSKQPGCEVHGVWADFVSRKAADAALSECLLAWARRAARLGVMP